MVSLAPGLEDEAKQLTCGQATLTCSFAFSCFSPPRCWPCQAAEGTESGTSESPFCRKMWVYNYCIIIIVCFTLPKRSVSGCWRVCAVGECFCCPSGRARLSWHFEIQAARSQVAVEWETRPTMVLRKNKPGARAAFLFCRSFNTLKKLRQEVKEIAK